MASDNGLYNGSRSGSEETPSSEGFDSVVRHDPRARRMDSVYDNGLPVGPQQQRDEVVSVDSPDPIDAEIDSARKQLNDAHDEAERLLTRYAMEKTLRNSGGVSDVEDTEAGNMDRSDGNLPERQRNNLRERYALDQEGSSDFLIDSSGNSSDNSLEYSSGDPSIVSSMDSLNDSSIDSSGELFDGVGNDAERGGEQSDTEPEALTVSRTAYIAKLRAVKKARTFANLYGVGNVANEVGVDFGHLDGERALYENDYREKLHVHITQQIHAEGVNLTDQEREQKRMGFLVAEYMRLDQEKMTVQSDAQSEISKKWDALKKKKLLGITVGTIAGSGVFGLAKMAGNAAGGFLASAGVAGAVAGTMEYRRQRVAHEDRVRANLQEHLENITQNLHHKLEDELEVLQEMTHRLLGGKGRGVAWGDVANKAAWAGATTMVVATAMEGLPKAWNFLQSGSYNVSGISNVIDGASIGMGMDSPENPSSDAMSDVVDESVNDGLTLPGDRVAESSLDEDFEAEVADVAYPASTPDAIETPSAEPDSSHDVPEDLSGLDGDPVIVYGDVAAETTVEPVVEKSVSVEPWDMTWSGEIVVNDMGFGEMVVARGESIHSNVEEFLIANKDQLTAGGMGWDSERYGDAEAGVAKWAQVRADGLIGELQDKYPNVDFTLTPAGETFTLDLKNLADIRLDITDVTHFEEINSTEVSHEYGVISSTPDNLPVVEWQEGVLSADRVDASGVVVPLEQIDVSQKDVGYVERRDLSGDLAHADVMQTEPRSVEVEGSGREFNDPSLHNEVFSEYFKEVQGYNGAQLDYFLEGVRDLDVEQKNEVIRGTVGAVQELFGPEREIKRLVDLPIFVLEDDPTRLDNGSTVKSIMKNLKADYAMRLMTSEQVEYVFRSGENHSRTVRDVIGDLVKYEYLLEQKAIAEGVLPHKGLLEILSK